MATHFDKMDSDMMDSMVTELMRQGTIGGHRTLQHMKRANFASNLFRAQHGGGIGGGDLRRLGGIAHSHNMTITQLQGVLHNELVELLRAELKQRLKAGQLGGHMGPLFDEIVNPDHVRS